MTVISSQQFSYLYYNDLLRAIYVNDPELRDLLADGKSRSRIACALSPGDKEPVRFEHQGKFVEISPGATGVPTNRDLDILIYCASGLSHEAYLVYKNTGKVGNASNTVSFSAQDFYDFSLRGMSGIRQDGFIQSLNRLSGSVLSTNILSHNKTETQSSELLAYKLDYEKGAIKTVQITFSDMVLRCVAHLGYRIELHPDYFTLKSTQRTIYLLAKMNCGTECPWTVSIEELHRLTGSMSKLAQFKQSIKSVLATQVVEFEIKADAELNQIYFTRIPVVSPRYSRANIRYSDE